MTEPNSPAGPKDEASLLGWGRKDGVATLSGAPIARLLAEAGVATPAYMYDLGAIRRRVELLVEAFGSAPHLIAYAVKANSSGSIVRTIAAAGGGLDAVSGGELRLGRAAGVEARKIVLSGVAKRDDEIDLAMNEDILAIQSESVGELVRIAARARALGRRARVSMRINPSVEIDSHAHIATGHDAAKFGVAQRDLADAWALLQKERESLELVGVSTHVGSMLKKTDSYLESANVVCDVALDAQQRGHRLEYVDFGGGFGIDYGPGPVSPPHDFAAAALGLLGRRGLGLLKLVVEPGRSLVGPFGVLVSRVVQHKQSGERSWVMLDAGMNDLMRPALYGARHRIEPLESEPGAREHSIVGPVCESTDDFGVHALGEVPGYVAIRDAGAYSFSMASEYNARPLPAEIFVDGGRVVHVSPSPGVEDWIARRLRA
ncbi:MAG TPA: diaminopimelate decarboxylase [Polyangiaceae bacterium]|nr:diaminopimelate decarboxylase [Polyangiaceae bacterium]